MRFFLVISAGFGVFAMVFGAAIDARAQGGWTDDGTVVRLTTRTDAVGIGTTTPGDKLHVIGNARISGRVVSEVMAAPGSTTLHLRIGGRDALRLDPTSGSPNIIGGADVNVVNPAVFGGTIAGGGDANLDPFFLDHPLPNVVTDDFGTVGGGRGNQAGDAAGTTSDAIAATVGGGQRNTAGGSFSTVGGGQENVAGLAPSKRWATVGGGFLNHALGHLSTIGGGFLNTADGSFSTVPGGEANAAQGDHSFAAGRQAKANHTGSFVWADSTEADFASQGDNEFLIRAAGGARVVKGASTFSLTLAAFQIENSAASGEGALVRNLNASNPNAAIKLIKAGTSNFLECRDNPGAGEVARCHIDSAGTFVAGSDFAEALPAKDSRAGYEPGDVLVLSADREGAVEKATRAHDARVAGVYSTRPAVLGADKDGATRVDPDDIPVAIVGIVPTKVSAENGAIKPGDLLTTATVSGHAMKASPVMVSGVALYPTGTILGKALGSLESGTGLIRVLVTLK
jgi:hypothetical protein